MATKANQGNGKKKSSSTASSKKKTPIKRAKTEHEKPKPAESAKPQIELTKTEHEKPKPAASAKKTEQNDFSHSSDIFSHSSDDASDDEYEPMTIDKRAEEPNQKGENAVEADSSLQVPEGRLLASPPGAKGNSVTGQIVGASAKKNKDGPTSLKVSLKVDSVKGAGKDVIQTDHLLSFVKAEQEKVTTANGTQLYATLVATDVSPTIKITSGIVQVTLPLKGNKGEREALVLACQPGADIELTGVQYSTWRMPMALTYMSCVEFKLKNKSPLDAPRDGVKMAIEAVLKKGHKLLLSAFFNCAHNDAKVASLMSNEKKAFGDPVTKLGMPYTSPNDPRRLLDDQHVAPVLAFYKVTVKHPKKDTTGLLFNSSQFAVECAKNGNLQNIHDIFNGAPIVSTDFEGTAGFRDNSMYGTLVEIHTKISYLLDYTNAPKKFKDIPTCSGPILKIPMAFLAASFGVDDRGIAELLIENVLPFGNMIMMPDKVKIDELKYTDPNYKQQLLLTSQCQLTIDPYTTFKNVALRLSRQSVIDLCGDSHSKPVVASGGGLIDAITKDDMKPQISTLVNGGVVSLGGTAVDLTDKTLEFFGVVKGMATIAQAEGNFGCGTNESVGDAAFKKALGEVSLTEMMKRGEAMIFAVRVARKTTSVASSSTAA